VNNPFIGIVGQNQAIELLKQAIAQNRIAPAYLFVGPDGIGRSMAARGFIELLFSGSGNADTLSDRIQQGNHPDLLWVEPTYLHQGQLLTAAEAAAAGVKRRAQPQIRVEQIRAITRFLSRAALEADRAIVVLEQADTMAEAAANGLLKTLEEPGQATLILIAPSVESLLPTLVSRCQRIPFYRLSNAEMTEVLQRTEHRELLQHPEFLQLAQGSPGAAISDWQYLQAIPDELLQALTHKFPQKLRDILDLARKIDKSLEPDAQLWLMNYLQHWYWRTYPGLTAPLQQFEKARQALLCYAQPRLVWEVTLIDLNETFRVRIQ
jgi:DNA polymerase III subunit delta'